MDDFKRIQFGRMCTLEFTNFTTKKKFTIDQNLRISFEFTKQFDESSSSSTGEIVIYGLTEETANKLGTRIKDMFQTEVECKVGYSGDPDNMQTLFYATVLNNQWYPTKGSSETRIRVSANFRDFKLGNIVSTSSSQTNLWHVLNEIPLRWGYAIDFDLYEVFSIVPDNLKDSVAESFVTHSVMNWSFTGNLDDFLWAIYKSFGIIHKKEEQDKTIRLRVHPKYAYYYANRVGKPEAQKYAFTVNKVDMSRDGQTKSIDSLYKAKKESKVAFILTWDTGLIDLPTIDNRNVVVPYDQTLASNEVLVKRKIIKPVIDKKTGEQKKDKDGNLKFTKPPKTMTINRRFLSAKALLNPAIKPDAIIVIDSGYQSVDGQYRVRDCRFIGDTHDGDWVVEMQLEDTTDSREAEVGTLPSEQENREVEVISNETTNDVEVEGGGGDGE